MKEDSARRVGAARGSSPPRRARPQQSLRARALSLLARREHSYAELRRKLGPHAECAEELTRLLEELQHQQLLSEQRFVEVLKRSRGARLGVARIEQELKAHQVAEPLRRAALDELRQTELERARSLWLRRFGAPAADVRERARQMRFLARRGFGADVIRTLVRGCGGDDP